jgi:hypothetical protein
MSFAWKCLRAAVNSLTGPGSQRERLLHAYTNITVLKQKDLPANIQNEFVKVLIKLVKPTEKMSHNDVRGAIEVLSDKDVARIIESFVEMYDAVTRYQPITFPTNNRTQVIFDDRNTFFDSNHQE